MRTSIRTSSIAAAMLFAAATVAFAQQPQPAPGGPLVLEPMSNTFVAAPDVKFTKVNDRAGTLAGGYAAWIHDEHLLVGGAGYWLANDNSDRGLAYGGLLAGWVVSPKSRLSVTAKSLVGFGRFSETFPIAIEGANPELATRFHDNRFPIGRNFRYRDDFFLVEPEVDVQFKIAQHVAVMGGVSYRAADTARGFEDLVRGPSGSVSVQFNTGK